MNKYIVLTAALTLLSQTALGVDTTGTEVQETGPLSGAPNTISASSVPAPTSTQTTIDCHYHIPSQTTAIENSIIQAWAQHATMKSFDFTPATIDDQLRDLKACFTEQGWQGFNDALLKSGNIDAIKSQHLTVSSQVEGNVSVLQMKDNQWKVVVPLQVVYQNDKEKLSQSLQVNLLVGRKLSGDLGIMQMVATPTQTNAPQSTPEPTPSNTTPMTTTTPADTVTTTTTTTPTPAPTTPTTTSPQTEPSPITPSTTP